MQAKTFAVNGSSDATKAIKKFETVRPGRPDPDHGHQLGPAGSVIPTTTFIVNGTANDDFGVNSLTFTFRDAQNRYLQDDGSTASAYNTFRGLPDVIGATSCHLVLRGDRPLRERMDHAGHRGRHRGPVRPAQRGPELDRQRHAPSPRPWPSPPRR